MAWVRDRRLRRWSFLIGLGLGAIVVLWSAPTALAAHRHRPCTPHSADTDHDHLPDCWEARNGLVVGRHDQRTDEDHDGMLAVEEYAIDVATTQDRGIFHPYRANRNSTAGNRYDDGEIDPDGDGFSNLEEVVFGTDPMDATSVPAVSGPSCVTVPTTVASDGSMNVTRRLQAVIDVVPDGGCLDLSPDARFRSDGMLRIAFRNNLTINGNGALIFTNVPGRVFNKGTPASRRKNLGIQGGTNITVDDLRIRGPNDRPRYNELYEFEAGVALAGVNGAVLSNLTISHVYGDFISFSQTGDQPTQNVLVTGGTFSIAGRQGLAFSESSNDITVENSSFYGMGRSGVDIELVADEKVLTNVTIQNNTWSHFRFFWVSAKWGTSTGIHFIDNSLVGETMQAKLGSPDWYPNRNSDFSFVGNTSDTTLISPAPLFAFHNTDSVTVEQNVQSFGGHGSRIGVGVVNGCGYTVSDNQFVDANVDLYWANGTPC